MPFEPNWKEESLSRAEVEALPGDTLLEFGAEWCPHCQEVQELVKARIADSELRHVKVADGKGKRLGREFKVKLWPNFVLLRDGVVVTQLARPSGFELEKLLDEAASD